MFTEPELKMIKEMTEFYLDGLEDKDPEKEKLNVLNSKVDKKLEEFGKLTIDEQRIVHQLVDFHLGSENPVCSEEELVRIVGKLKYQLNK